MNQSKTRAVIVGINQYTHSRRLRLRGSVNDARAWVRFCIEDWGLPPEEVVVVTSPKLDVAAMGERYAQVRATEATRENMLQALEALRNHLAASVADIEAGGGHPYQADTGLFTYSGHGLATEGWRSGAGESLMLCPTDITFSDDHEVIGNALSYTDLQEVLWRKTDDGNGPADRLLENLTIVLDTCQNNAHRTATSRSALTAKPGSFEVHPGSRDKAAEPIGRRVLLAATLDQVSEEMWTEAGWRGAFSHTLTTLLRRWERSTKDDHSGKVTETPRYYQVSYNQLLSRSNEMLAGLGCKQTPILIGHPAVGEMAAFKAGVEGNPGETRDEPNRPGGGRQFPVNANEWAWVSILIDEFVVAYMLVLGSEAGLLTSLSTKKGTIYQLVPNNEFWFAATEHLGDIKQATSLTWNVQAMYADSDHVPILVNAINNAAGLADQQTTAPVPLFASMAAGEVDFSDPQSELVSSEVAWFDAGTTGWTIGIWQKPDQTLRKLLLGSPQAPGEQQLPEIFTRSFELPASEGTPAYRSILGYGV